MTNKPPLIAAIPFSLTDDQYGQLRAALVLFFRSRGSVMPEDHASEAILRILEGAARGVTIEDLHGYAHGIAKHVLHEHWRETNRNVLPILREAPAPDELSQRCLKGCRRRLTPEERRLIQAYYDVGAGASKIASHRRLAESLGISVEALRLRAHRIRKKLAACVEECRRSARAEETKSPFPHVRDEIRRASKP